MPAPYNPRTFKAAADKSLCLYIAGDPRGTEATICGMPRQTGTVYCPHHRAKCVTAVVKVTLPGIQ